MLKTMRTNTKWIMIIVAVCFIGMMIFAWGMDIGSRGTGSGGNVVGKVNGEDIPYTFFDSVVKNQRQQQTAAGERLSLNEERRLYEDAWNNIVMQTLIQQDIDKRGISYTDMELVNFMKNNPPELVYQIPLFQENEQFSMEKYRSFINADNLSNPQMAQVLQYIEQEARRRLPSLKFQQTLMNSVTVTEQDVRDRWLMENEKVEADWVFVNASNLSGVNPDVPAAEQQEYYDANRDDFRADERRILNAVFFRLEPTKEDSTEILDLAETVLDRAREGADFAELANEYTDDPGNNRRDGTQAGGDLGFFGRGRMVPVFEETAFGMEPGEISEPVISQFGYHIIKVDSVRYKEDDPDEIDQVKARHILFRVEPSGETRDRVESRVTAFYETVQAGMDFTAQAQIDSLQITRSRPFEKDAMSVPGIPGSSQLLVHRAFANKEGAVLPVYPVDGGYFVMQVADVLPAGIQPLEEVSMQVSSEILRERRVGYAEEFIGRVQQRMQQGQTLQEAVEADTEYSDATARSGELYRSYFIPGLGSMNEFVAKIFTLENPGDSTGPVVTEQGCGIAVLKQKLPVDEEQFEQDKSQLRARMLNDRRNDYMNRYLEGLHDHAEIVDNRHMFVNM